MMQAGKDYGVRVIRAYGFLSVGQIIFPLSGVEREMLLMTKCVEEVKPPEEPVVAAPEKPKAAKPAKTVARD